MAYNSAHTGAEWDALYARDNSQPLGIAGFTAVPDAYFTRIGATPTSEAYADGKFTVTSVSDLGNSIFYAETVSGDFERYYCCTGRLPNDNNAAIGVFIGDAGNTHRSIAMVSLANSNFLVQNFTGTTFSSNGTNTGVSALVGVTALANSRHYWKLVRVGVAVDAYFSTDGLNWTHVGDWTSTEDGIVTLDQVGLYYETSSLTSGRPMGLTVHGVDTAQPAEMRI